LRGSATGQLKSAPRAERIERTLRVSQKKLLEETRARLHRHPLNQPIADMADELFFRELIARHRHYSTKFASGVRYFFPAKNIGFNVALMARLNDGCAVCTGRVRTHTAKVKAAFRWEIHIHKPRGCDGHHAREYSFATLYNLFWLSGVHGSEADVQVDEDGGLVDPKLAEAWKQFHNSRAEWEVLDRIEHRLKHKAVKP
jgi:hypothetical protein